MAALLAVFHPVPAMIRKRAKDLLDAIRVAVKQALTSPEASASDEKSVEQTSTDMSVDEGKAPATSTEAAVSLAATSLWSSGKHSLGRGCIPHTQSLLIASSITAPASSLFGPSLRRNVAPVLPVATQSALWGAHASTVQ